MDSSDINQEASQDFSERTTAQGSNSLLQVMAWLLLLAGLLYLCLKNYLLYHSSVELLSVVVAVTIFSIGWNSRHFVHDNTLLVLAVAYLPIGALDFLHVLSYKGMGVFPNDDSNLPTQLWIAARYLEGGALLCAATLLGNQRRLNHSALLITSVVLGAGLCAAIVQFRLFPDCYIEGQGLTTFKVISEYVISLLLAVATLIFWTRRQFLNRRILNLLLASAVVTILSELSFTLYADVYGLFNFIGHSFKLISVVLVYFALVQGSLVSPYQSLFRKLTLELDHRKKSEAKLRTANSELDAFVYTVSHDLRSPLTPIIGYAEYLHEQKADSLDEQSLEMLQDIKKLGCRMSDSMDDLLTLANVGQLKKTDELVSSAEIVDQVVLTQRHLMKKTGQDVHRKDMPDVRFPESLLSQVFSNLIGNALRYGDEGGNIQVGGSRQGNLVRYYVRDHGPGIPEEERERIFDLFYRSHQGKQIKGTGIGLAIVKKIVNLYNGKVWVEETQGGGATFCVELEEPSSKF